MTVRRVDELPVLIVALQRAVQSAVADGGARPPQPGLRATMSAYSAS